MRVLGDADLNELVEYAVIAVSAFDYGGLSLCFTHVWIEDGYLVAVLEPDAGIIAQVVYILDCGVRYYPGGYLGMLAVAVLVP